MGNVSELALSLTIFKFIKGAKSFRSYLIDNVRKNAVEIFSIDALTKVHHYSTSYNRSQVPAVIDLLTSPKNPDENYALYPQVLFTSYEVVNDELFGSPALLKVGSLCLVCFGSYLRPL